MDNKTRDLMEDYVDDNDDNDDELEPITEDNLQREIDLFDTYKLNNPNIFTIPKELNEVNKLLKEVDRELKNLPRSAKKKRSINTASVKPESESSDRISSSKNDKEIFFAENIQKELEEKGIEISLEEIIKIGNEKGSANLTKLSNQYQDVDNFGIFLKQLFNDYPKPSTNYKYLYRKYKTKYINLKKIV